MEEKRLKKIPKIDKKNLILIVLVIVIILIDQILKMYIVNAKEIEIIPNVFRLSLAENKDAAYGVGNDSTLMYILTNFVVLSILFKFIKSQNQFIGYGIKIFASLIFAGGISNVIDRICRGYVVQYMDFTQSIGLPIINIADICIIIGWVSFAAVFAAFTAKELQSKKDKKQS